MHVVLLTTLPCPLPNPRSLKARCDAEHEALMLSNVRVSPGKSGSGNGRRLVVVTGGCKL